MFVVTQDARKSQLNRYAGNFAGKYDVAGGPSVFQLPSLVFSNTVLRTVFTGKRATINRRFRFKLGT